MRKEQRKEWVDAGFKDPVEAFRSHLTSACQRGIPFRLTFEQWWELWEPHYRNRGAKTGQMCMCRTLDEGAYEIGNVRIDVNKANSQERGIVQKIKSAQTSYWNKDIHRPTPPTSTGGDWMWRGDVFREYSEEGLDE